MSAFSWPEVHGALTHFPVALLITACVFEIGAVVSQRPAWRTVSFWLLAAAVVMALPTLAVGWVAGDTLFGKTPRPPDIFVRHRATAFATSGLALALLLWRIVSKDRLEGSARWGAVLLALLAAGGVGYTGYLGGRMLFGSQSQEQEHAEEHAEGHRGAHGEEPAAPGQPRPVSPQLAATGQKLFQSRNCLSCHKMNGQGGTLGPDLTHEGQAHPDMGWQIAHLKHPDQVHPGSVMPSFAYLKPEELQALAAFLVTRR
ncbi:MAG TPA: DUF2231 domain-containing protein [Chthonomonadaceae bacterium]|nr:DUF2231 domain-containing protein [Chthonomonadaceae bacterium]